MPTTATKTKKNISKSKTTKRVIAKKPSNMKAVWPTYNAKSNVSFNTWFNQFTKAFSSNATSWGFTTSQVNAISKAFNAWGASYTAWQNVQSTFGTATKPATRKASTARKSSSVRKSVKPAAKPVSKNGRTKPVSKKKTISRNGTSKNNGKSTRAVVSAIAPKSYPHFNFDWSKTGRCTIWFGTSPSNSKNNHFPSNAKSVCLQFRINNGTWKTLTTTTKYHFTHFVSSPAPKNLQYRACYIGMTGKKGPWHVSNANPAKAAA
jgi:hypothetical protein